MTNLSVSKISLLIIFGLLTFCGLETFVCKRRTQADVELAISKSPRLQRIDKFCTDLPKPAGFRFVYKDIGGNNLRDSLSFLYKSEQRSDDVRQFYSTWFNENGWQRHSDGSSNFVKNKQTIAVSYNGNYSIYCSEDK